MKVCPNCNHNNSDESLYCSKCGNKFKKEVDLGKIVLLVGVFLVMFSSIFFGILNWENMDNLFRLLFFVFETCLFYLMSLALKKVSDKTSRIFFIIGLLLTPFTLSMLPYYNLIPSILYNKALIFIYLALVYAITFGAYLLINIKFKSKPLEFFALLSLLISVIFGCLIFTENIVIIGLAITIYMLILSLLFKLLNNKIYYYFSLTLSFVLVPYLVICFLQTEKFEMILNGITMLIFMIDVYIKMFFNEKTILHFFAPFMLQTLTFVYIGTVTTTHDVLAMILITLANIALYFITWIFKNKMFSITTLVLTYTMVGFLSLFCMFTDGSMCLAIINGICLLFNLILVIFKKYNIAHFIITVNVLTLVLGLNSWLYSFNSEVIVGFLLILYLIIYLILNLIKNKFDFVYLIIMMAIGLVASIMLGDSFSTFSIIKLIICATFAIGYILINLFKENVSIRIIWFIVLNFLLLTLFGNLYYSLLTVSLFTIISSFLLEKATGFNFKPYVLYAEIVIFVITLFNTMEYNIYSLFVNILAFVLGYICLLKYHNKKAWKIAYVMVGLLFLTKLIGVIVEPVVISSLISLFIILIMITAMYLLDAFDSKELVIISLVALVPYYSLIGNIYSGYPYYYGYGPDYLRELYLIPFVVYAIVLTFVIKWKSNSARNVFILIPFFALAAIFLFINSGVVSTIIDAVYAVTYIILGLVKKYNLLVFFAIGYLVLTILFQIFTVLNSMAAIIALLVVGFILIFVAVLYTTRKKD